MLINDLHVTLFAQEVAQNVRLSWHMPMNAFLQFHVFSQFLRECRFYHVLDLSGLTRRVAPKIAFNLLIYEPIYWNSFTVWISPCTLWIFFWNLPFDDHSVSEGALQPFPVLTVSILLAKVPAIFIWFKFFFFHRGLVFLTRLEKVGVSSPPLIRHALDRKRFRVTKILDGIS